MAWGPEGLWGGPWGESEGASERILEGLLEGLGGFWGGSLKLGGPCFSSIIYREKWGGPLTSKTL